MNLSVEGKCDFCNPDVVVDSPAGANDTVDLDMCQCRVEVSNTAAGDYRITVGESRKGEKWKGAFVLKIEVRRAKARMPVNTAVMKRSFFIR